ncbi:MAG: TolC family protein, partial [Cetobacterium sp.]
YNAGLISTVDYLLSESQYREAAVAYNSAILNYYVAFEKYRSSLI